MDRDDWRNLGMDKVGNDIKAENKPAENQSQQTSSSGKKES